MLQKAIKEILSLTTLASGMKAHAQIGAWHNSLDRMAAVILVSPLLNYFYKNSNNLTYRQTFSTNQKP